MNSGCFQVAVEGNYTSASGQLAKWSHHSVTTDRRSQAVAEFVGEGQMNKVRWKELSIVLNGDQTCVQGGSLTIKQGGGLWAYPTPITWRTERGEGKSALCVVVVLIAIFRVGNPAVVMLWIPQELWTLLNKLPAWRHVRLSLQSRVWLHNCSHATGNALY